MTGSAADVRTVARAVEMLAVGQRDAPADVLGRRWELQRQQRAHQILGELRTYRTTGVTPAVIRQALRVV